jgi:nucleoside-diphosphate-sugar epimerase
MRVAVTGASGFLGGRTVAALRRRGHTVRALMRRRARRDPIAPFVDEWRTGSLSDPAAIARLVRGTGAVVHIAMDWTALSKGMVASLNRNLEPSLRLLEASRAAGGQFLFVSSLEAAAPASLYGAFKAAVEAHITAYHVAHGLNASAWRPATLIGVNPRLDRSHWFEAARRAKRGETPPDPGNSDVVWVEDVADALALAVGDPAVAGQTFHLADAHVPGATAVALARSLAVSKPLREAPLPRPSADSGPALAFFARHGRPDALRRGRPGIERYLRELLKLVDSAGASGPS